MSWKSFAILALVGLAAAPRHANAQCTTIAAAASNANLTSLLAALTAVGLAPTFSDTSATGTAYTVFAPVNAAFTPVLTMIGTPLDKLNTTEKALVASVLSLHVVKGTVLAADIVAGTANLTTLAGVVLKSDGATVSVPGGNTAKIVAADAATGLCAGSAVHVIDTVLLPAAAGPAPAGNATMSPPMSMTPPGASAPPTSTTTSPPLVSTTSTSPPKPTGAAAGISMVASAMMAVLAAMLFAMF